MWKCVYFVLCTITYFKMNFVGSYSSLYIEPILCAEKVEMPLRKSTKSAFLPMVYASFNFRYNRHHDVHMNCTMTVRFSNLHEGMQWCQTQNKQVNVYQVTLFAREKSLKSKILPLSCREELKFECYSLIFTYPSLQYSIPWEGLNTTSHLKWGYSYAIIWAKL